MKRLRARLEGRQEVKALLGTARAAFCLLALLAITAIAGAIPTPTPTPVQCRVEVDCTVRKSGPMGLEPAAAVLVEGFFRCGSDPWVCLGATWVQDSATSDAEGRARLDHEYFWARSPAPTQSRSRC